MSESRKPATAYDARCGELRFRGIGSPVARGGSFDVVVQADHSVRFERPSPAQASWMVFPPLADLHVHANRAFTLGAELPDSLEHAIRIARDLFRQFDADDYARQAARFFAHAVHKGTMRVRTHADVAAENPLAAVRGTLIAAERFRERLDVEVVAFAADSCDPIEERVAEQLREACALGAGLLGAVPAYYADPRASIDALLDLADTLGVPVDVHLDEHLDAARSHSEYLARATLSRGLHGRVTLSHGCTIAMLDRDARLRVADALARAGITVIVLPTTNLYLQGRGAGVPKYRGLTAVKELAAAGVPLRFASDNVRDAFFPYGAADLLDVANLAVMAAQIDDAELIMRGVCAGVREVATGAEANFVLVPGASLTDVLAERPEERIVILHGVVMEALQPQG